jgi:hypothetical protein
MRAGVRAFDAAEAWWEDHATQRALGAALVAAFLAAVALIELHRRGLLPSGSAVHLPASHFGAVGIVFTLLLVVEIVGLVFALARSVANAVGKQFELLSLILLRKTFLEVSKFAEPIEWPRVAESVPHIAADLFGALAVFLLTGAYYRMQRHVPITADADDQQRFVRVKKLVALALLATLAVSAAGAAPEALRGGRPEFFERFYTLLVFSDILIVLVSLAFTTEYRVVFRNSGFAAATVLIRLALTAPPYVNVLLSVGGAAFIVLLSLAYNAMGRSADAPGATGERIVAVGRGDAGGEGRASSV